MEQQSRPSYVVTNNGQVVLCSTEQGLTGEILIVHSEPYLLKNISPFGAESGMILMFNRPQSSNSSFSNQIIVCVFSPLRVVLNFESRVHVKVPQFET